MKLRLAADVVVTHGNQTISGTVIHLDPDGFWIQSPDGMAYHFVLSSDGTSGDSAHEPAR
jgi:hypothetical protein